MECIVITESLPSANNHSVKLGMTLNRKCVKRHLSFLMIQKIEKIMTEIKAEAMMKEKVAAEKADEELNLVLKKIKEHAVTSKATNLGPSKSDGDCTNEHRGRLKGQI